MENPPSFSDAILGLAFLGLFFFGLRIFLLWYFRINKVIELLASIDKKLGPESDPAPPGALANIPKCIARLQERFGRSGTNKN